MSIFKGSFKIDIEWQHRYTVCQQHHRPQICLVLFIKMSSVNNRVLFGCLELECSLYLGGVGGSLTPSGVLGPYFWALCISSSGACLSGSGIFPPAGAPALSVQRWPHSPRPEGRTLISTGDRRSCCARSASKQSEIVGYLPARLLNTLKARKIDFYWHTLLPAGVP